jgi:hypothetical protein
MTSKEELKNIVDYLSQKHYPFAVVGAYALHAYGYTRATRDVDFLTRIEYQDEIVGHLESLGFETLHRSDGYSNHLHAANGSRVDFVYVEGKTADTVLGSAQNRLVMKGLAMPVVSPEHLVALKLFSIANDPGRKLKELADIREVVRLTKMDNDTLTKIFKEYGMSEFIDEVTE